MNQPIIDSETISKDAHERISVMKFDLDSDGYPTEASLEEIRNYTGSTLEFFRGLKDGWWCDAWGYSEHGVNADGEIEFSLSTGGWSGNEDTIRAMRDNVILWHKSWYRQTVGGHFEFKVAESSEVSVNINLRKLKRGTP